MTGVPPTYQIWELTELRKRLPTVDPSVNVVEVFTGHLYPGQKLTSSIKQLELRRDSSGNWPLQALDYLERSNGDYTAIFKPTREYFLMSSVNNRNMFSGFGYMPMNGQAIAYAQWTPERLVMRILELEKQVSEYQDITEELKEELEQFETASGKLQHTLGNVLLNYVMPVFVNHNSPSVMQGSEQGTTWTTRQIMDKNGDGGAQDAMQIIYEAFGHDDLIRVARKLQSQPGLVNTLRAML